MISKKEVQHIARLARLSTTKQEEEKFQNELFLILGYVGKLKKVDISRVEPTSHPFKIENVIRNDEVRKACREKHRLLSGFLRVKSIF